MGQNDDDDGAYTNYCFSPPSVPFTACPVKVNVDPLNTFPWPLGRMLREGFKEEKIVLADSSVLAWQSPAACGASSVFRLLHLSLSLFKNIYFY